MTIQKTVSVIFASSIILFTSSVMAEGRADRQNEGSIESIDSAMLVIQHINKSFGPTAAGGHDAVDTKLAEQLDALKMKYAGTRNEPKYKNMTASEFRKEVFGSN